MKSTSFLALFSLLFSVFFASGCHTPEKDNPQTAQWLEKLRQEIKNAETPFFGSGFMQNDSDPFYLNEVVQMINQANGPLSNYEKENLKYLKQNVQQTCMLLRKSLVSLEKLYAITGSIPAYELDALLEKIIRLPDIATKQLFLEFEKLLSSDSIYDEAKKCFKKEALEKAFELSERIQERVLARARSVEIAGLSKTRINQLESLQEQVMNLNPALTIRMGYALTGDPQLTWKALDEHYTGVLGIFSMAEAALDARTDFNIEWGSLKTNELLLLSELKARTNLQHELSVKVTKEH